MLYITFTEPRDVDRDKEMYITGTSIYFKNTYKPEWITDELAKRIIKDIDKSDVLSGYCIQSPVLGQIPPERLSGGVKMMLIMMNSPENYLYCGEMFGDNCLKWVIEIAKHKDIRITMSYLKNFDGIDSFEAYITNTGNMVHNYDELDEEYYNSDYFENMGDYEEE